MPSKLEAYTQNYGQTLQRMLTPPGQPPAVTDTTPVLGRPTAPVSALEQPQPGAAVAQPVQQQQRTPDQSALEEPQQPSDKDKGDGTSVRKLFKDLPDAEQEKQAKDLSDALEKGGKTVDEAYDELIKQMGTRPDEGLTKKDKSMLLMEFGLNLMVNSSGKNYGQDLSGALGATGLNTMDSYQHAKGARTRQYDAQKSALETGRVKDKLDLGLAGTAAEIKSDATLPHEFAPLRPDRDQFAGGDGFMYETVDGKAQKILDENGKPIKAPEKELRSGSGGGEKVFEFDHRKTAFMEARGYKWDGTPMSGDLKPLEGEALRKMRQQATDYAGDTKGASQSDEEVMQLAQRAVDEQMRFSMDAYRDYTPAQLEAERKRLLQIRLKEIKAGRSPTSALEGPGPAAATPGPLRDRPGSAFETAIPKTPPTEALVAGKARRIKGYEGRWTLVNGKPSRVD